MRTELKCGSVVPGCEFVARADDDPPARTKRAQVRRRASVDAGTTRDRVRTRGAPGASLEKKTQKALSVGSPNAGRLEGGVHLDLSKPYFRVLPASAAGDGRWGLPQLVHMLDRAARAVHKKFPGSVLDVGDLSKKGGGDVLRHHSHESGRDADVGFYVVDARYSQQRPTIVTSGLRPDAFRERYGDAMWRRLTEKGIGDLIDTGGRSG